ncbi:MAG: purine-nucleoside phosphorylase [Rikenellaceae bacterium]
MIDDIVKFLDTATDNFRPKVGVVLGSGLGSFADAIEVRYSIPYSDIEGFPLSTVQGHDGCLIFGFLGGVKVVIVKGRFHYYEGYSLEQVVLPIRVLALLGVGRLLLSNAAGALNKSFKMGDMMIITNHINFIPNPLIGRNDERFGTRFPDMKQPYSLSLIKKAKEFSNNIKEGVYVACTGPSYETAAEVDFYRMIGGDAVGMSTVPEVIAARHMGLEVFAMSLITNSTDLTHEITHEEVLAEGEKAAYKMVSLFKALTVC